MPLSEALRGRYEINLVAEMTCSQVWVDAIVRTIASSWITAVVSACVWECMSILSFSWPVALAAPRAPC